MIDLLALVLHFDQYLSSMINEYGILVYAILFLIIFLETGIVVTPFLPGDSLLFVAGLFAALGSLNIWTLLLLLCVAAVLGDTVNYWLGNKFGSSFGSRFLKRDHLERARTFYEKHGASTIIIARFVPIIRTFAPFVAGIGKMRYSRFLSYNVLGGIAWVSLFLFGGFYLGNVPAVRDNLALTVIAIIVVSLLIAFVEMLRHRK